MEASSLAGRLGVAVVKMSDNVAARSKSRLVRPGGAVVQVTGVVGVVGAVCARSGTAAENAISRIAAVAVGSIRFQGFIDYFSSRGLRRHTSALSQAIAGVGAPGFGCRSVAQRAPRD